MLTRRIISTLLVYGIGVVTAQSVSNDIPANQTLEIVYGDGVRRIHAPGAQMHPGYMDKQPSILTPTWPSGSAGMLLMLDLDTPYGDTRVSSLHWLVTGISPSTSQPSSSPNSEDLIPLTIPTSQVQYNPPNPPAGDVAHTYAFYLIAPLPSPFNLPAGLERNRTPFTLGQFLKDAGLGEESIVARNHFRIRDLKGLPTMSLPAPRASETAPALDANAVVPTPSGVREVAAGRGGKVQMSVGWGALVGLVGVVAAVL